MGLRFVFSSIESSKANGKWTNAHKDSKWTKIILVTGATGKVGKGIH